VNPTDFPTGTPIVTFCRFWKGKNSRRIPIVIPIGIAADFLKYSVTGKKEPEITQKSKNS
jgi:hypothetical protein